MKPSKPHDLPAQRMSLTIQQWSTAGLNVLASRTAERGVPGVVLLQVHEEPFELEWKLTPEQARALSEKLLEAAATCTRLDRLTCQGQGNCMIGADPTA